MSSTALIVSGRWESGLYLSVKTFVLQESISSQSTVTANKNICTEVGRRRHPAATCGAWHYDLIYDICKLAIGSNLLVRDC